MSRSFSSARFMLATVLTLLGTSMACSTSSPNAQGDDSDASTASTATPEPTSPPPDSTTPEAGPPVPADPDEALPPTVDSVNPSRATVGSVGPAIVVVGNNFVPRSIVQLDGAPLATTFVSDSELRATIPTPKLTMVGTLRISVGTSAPGGGASKELAFQVENPVASVTQLSPLSVVTGAAATELHVFGSKFVTGAKIVVSGTDLATTFVSDSELVGTLASSVFATSASLPVKVRNPSPGGGDSNDIVFTVANPDAGLDGINPQGAFVGSASLDMTIHGAGFVGNSTVLFNGASLKTTFVDTKTLTATVPSSLLGAAGDFPVTVNNPPPGGGVSKPSVFRIEYPAPSATALSPQTVARFSGATDVVVSGIGFFPTSQITFDGSPAATTYVDATHLKATLDSTQLINAKSVSVRVVNTPPGGGTSSALPLVIANPSPSLTTVAPLSVPSGSSDTDVTLTGSGFVPESTVTSNGLTVATTYMDATHLKATFDHTLLSKAQTFSLRVVNPTPGGGSSSTLSFAVTNPGPAIASLAPSSVSAGAPDTLVTLTGSGFVPESSITSNAVALSTTYVDGSHLSVTIPSGQLVNPGSVSIRVSNPGPGGGASNVASLVIGCDTSGVDVPLGAVGTLTTLQTNFAAATKLPVFASASACTTSSIYNSPLEPARSWVVQNTTNSTVTLSAWADCTNDNKGDAFLTFYRRPTPPTSTSDRLVCEGAIAEGVNGNPGFSSPDSGGSMWCPGLTKANGGGLVLSACEKAVVHIQAYDDKSTTQTMPPVVKVKPE